MPIAYKALLSLAFAAVPFMASAKEISATCRFQKTEILISFHADLDAKKISLSGLKDCDLTGNTDKVMNGICAVPRFRDVDFVIEYDKSTDVGRWWIEVAGKPVSDEDGRVVDFPYFCGADAQ